MLISIKSKKLEVCFSCTLHIDLCLCPETGLEKGNLIRPGCRAVLFHQTHHPPFTNAQTLSRYAYEIYNEFAIIYLRNITMTGVDKYDL